MPENLTILHTEASDGWGGQEIRILTESRWMRERGHRVIIAGPKNGCLFRKAAEEGFETLPFPFLKKTELPDFIRMVNVLKRLRPDVVASHSSVDSWVGLAGARFCRVPCVVRYRHFGFSVRNSLLNRLQYTRLCDRVITTADYISDGIRKAFDLMDERIWTISTGVSRPKVSIERETARRQLCSEVGLPDSSRFVGCVSVLRGGKGHDTVMESFQALSDRFPDLYLVIVGDGPIKNDLLQLRRDLPCAEKVFFLGHKADPWPYFRAFDVFVQASTKPEGVPQSLLQAMLAETPAIGSQIGGIPEVVSHEVTGLVVPPGDVGRLAQALERVLSRWCDLEGMTAGALQQVEEEYSVERMGQRVLSVYRQVLDESGCS